MKGKYFVQDRGLMILGRAVNGWTKEAWSPLEVADQSKRERKRIINGIRELSESEDADRWKFSHDRVVNLRRGVEIEISNSACPLSLVVQNAGAKNNKENAGPEADYNTNQSAFWRVARKVLWACYPETVE